VYPVGSDAAQTLSYRNEALAELADEVAEEVYIRLLILLTGPAATLPQVQADPLDDRSE
jgi:hypothetical protein